MDDDEEDFAQVSSSQVDDAFSSGSEDQDNIADEGNNSNDNDIDSLLDSISFSDLLNSDTPFPTNNRPVLEPATNSVPTASVIYDIDSLEILDFPATVASSLRASSLTVYGQIKRYVDAMGNSDIVCVPFKHPYTRPSSDILTTSFYFSLSEEFLSRRASFHFP